MNIDQDYVSVTLEEYNELVYAKQHLDLLKAAGVDNWIGYDVPENRADDDL